MKRIMFLGFWIMAAAQISQAIEIYAQGRKYDSLKAYEDSRKAVEASNAASHRLYVLSVEKGMVEALKDFYSHWRQADLQITQITPRQLQDAIQQAVTSSKDPKLLIAQPGKVSIMEREKD